ncbi:glutathione S-transferase [Pasteurellaceae bacterium Pebbles2]|nr:glutathione S-transferase [Pasteurellaceae bacterium Pebbles2]
MYQLHFYAPYSSWSLRPWILLKELNIPFEEKQIPYLQDKTALRQLLAQISPTAKIPLLTDGDTVIWDSLAIVEYLAEEYPQVWAQDKDARAWSRSVCAEMHSGFEQLRTFCNYDPLKRFNFSEICTAVEQQKVLQELQRIDQIWSQGLSRFGGDYLAGDKFTAVDAFFAPVVGRIEIYGLHGYLSDATLRYQQKIQHSATLQQWLNKENAN